MPQTVLRGPDGGPAIDQMTGLPLTMEEMLRRNGIVATGNTVSMMGPQSDPNAAAGPNAASTPSSAADPRSAVQAAMAQRSGSAGVNPGVNPNPAPNPNDPAAHVASDANMQALEQHGIDPDTLGWLETAGLVAGGTAAAYLAYRKLRGMGGTTSGSTGGVPPTGDAPMGDAGLYAKPPIEDAHFTEIDSPRLEGPRKQIGDATKKAMAGRSAAAQIEGHSSQKALPAPQGKLPNNGRTATAKAMADRAARGGPTDVGTIRGTPPVRSATEAAENGVARTLGVPVEVINMLKKNPGLIKTLTRLP